MSCGAVQVERVCAAHVALGLGEPDTDLPRAEVRKLMLTMHPDRSKAAVAEAMADGKATKKAWDAVLRCKSESVIPCAGLGEASKRAVWLFTEEMRAETNISEMLRTVAFGETNPTVRVFLSPGKKSGALLFTQITQKGDRPPERTWSAGEFRTIGDLTAFSEPLVVPFGGIDTLLLKISSAGCVEASGTAVSRLLAEDIAVNIALQESVGGSTAGALEELARMGSGGIDEKRFRALRFTLGKHVDRYAEWVRTLRLDDDVERIIFDFLDDIRWRA